MQSCDILNPLLVASWDDMVTGGCKVWKDKSMVGTTICRLVLGSTGNGIWREKNAIKFGGSLKLNSRF